MSLGVRGKLFAVSLLLISSVGVASGAYLEHALHGWLLSMTETELSRHVRTFREVFAALPADVKQLDAVADRLGKATSMRVTLIALDGRVWADSDLSLQQLSTVENHSGRPEVRAALATGRGTSRRYSTSVGSDLLYLAVPVDRPVAGVVRVATPLRDVERAIWHLRTLLAVAALLGLVTAVFMSGLASHMMSRALRTLVEKARSLAQGARPHLPDASPDELGTLAGSMNRLARELDRSVAALVQERDRLDAVLQGMSDAVIAIDRDARITMVNQATTALLDMPQDAVGKPLVDMVRVPELIDLAERTTTEPQAVELSMGLSPVRHLQARANPIRATGGTVIVIQDTTEIRRLETVRRDFVANVSHELRTPVSVIQANAETLLSGALDHPEHAKRFTEAIHRNAERLTAIIADLLDLTRIESGKLQLRPEPVDLHDAATHAIDTVAELAKTRGTQVINEVSEELLVEGDAQALDQVLMNLIGNAVKYSGERKRVVVRAKVQGNEVRIEVEDDGPGIEEHHRERIFERFYRIDAGRSRDVGGTGLGLSIVKHLVTALDGKLGIEPVTPHGARFWFTLPLAR